MTSSMRVYYSKVTINNPLITELDAKIIYRCSVIKRTPKNRKMEAKDILLRSINNTWQTAEAISIKTGIRYHQAAKLLLMLSGEKDVEIKRVDFVDSKKRIKSKYLYRKQKDMASIYNSILGFTNPLVHVAGRVHLLDGVT